MVCPTFQYSTAFNWWFLLTVCGPTAYSWTTTTTTTTTTSPFKFHKITGKQQQQLYSTPFELDYYDDASSNPYSDGGDQPSSLACPADTKLVLGLNKYSHDASLCAANAETGEVLFAIAKERLSRKKNDSGNVLTMVESCLESLDLDYDAIQKVVMNNHHHRILPLEENRAHMEWESALGINGGVEAGYEEEENLLPDAERVSAYECCCRQHFVFALLQKRRF